MYIRRSALCSKKRADVEVVLVITQQIRMAQQSAQNSSFMEGDMIKAVQAVVGLGLLCLGATQAVVAATDISKLPRVKQ